MQDEEASKGKEIHEGWQGSGKKTIESDITNGIMTTKKLKNYICSVRQRNSNRTGLC